MGQIVVPGTPPSIILSAVDRLVAANADGGVSPLAEHIILFGEDAGMNLGDLDGVIAMGGFALDAGLADTDLAGFIAIGFRAASAVTGGTNNDDATSASVVIGNLAGEDAVVMSGMVIIGAQALQNFVGDAVSSGPERGVVIGNEAGQNLAGATQFTSNTLVGWRVLRGGVGNVSAMVGNVMIGDNIAVSAGGPITLNTVVGSQAGRNMGAGGANASENVIIGEGAGTSIDFGDQNVLVGRATDCTATGAGEQSNNVLVGFNAIGYGSKNVVVGSGAATSPGFGAVGQRSIVIGYRAGALLGANTTDLFIVETFDGAQRGMLYGDLLKGCLILGNSNDGVDRDTGGLGSTNLVKILNGTIGAAPPVGGGFLFCTAGELKFQSVAGAAVRKLTSPGVAVIALGAPIIGARDFVNDALAPAFGAAVVGGGAVFTPVYSDGVGWFVG